MKTVVDPTLREQARRFELRFACEDCAHYRTEEMPACSLAYPAAPMRSALEGHAVEFCKSFELA